MILHIGRGVALRSLFHARTQVDGNTVKVKGAAVFSNFIPVKKELLKFPYSSDVIFDVRDCVLVDHSVIETLHHLKDDFASEGGSLNILGIDEFRPISKHKLSVIRKHKNNAVK